LPTCAASRPRAAIRSSTDALADGLAQSGIGYVHLPELGGRREPRSDSPHGGWRETGFRGYADYMDMPPFDRALETLIGHAKEESTAILCAEADWRSCHRGLIADALKLRGFDVRHLVDATRSEAHPYTEPARIIGGRLAYPAPEPAQRSLDL
jgi:uncharacterized protein (DUF488 family)